MNLERTSIKKEAKQKLKGNLVSMMIVMSISIVINIVDFILSPVELGPAFMSLVLQFVTILVSFVSINLGLNIARNKQPNIAESFKYIAGKYFKLLGAQILLSLIILGGIILFVVPGIILALKFNFTVNLLIDNPDMGIMEALKESSALTQNHKMDLFIFQLSFIGWVLLIIVTLGLASFYVQPYMLTATCVYYTKLLGEDNKCVGEQPYVEKSEIDLQ